MLSRQKKKPMWWNARKTQIIVGLTLNLKTFFQCLMNWRVKKESDDTIWHLFWYSYIAGRWGINFYFIYSILSLFIFIYVTLFSTLSISRKKLLCRVIQRHFHAINCTIPFMRFNVNDKNLEGFLWLWHL